MPHIEIKYSDNLTIDIDHLFDVLEDVINESDSSAGECKSRAYPCAQYKYSHLLVSVSLLSKAHRDSVFTQSLSTKIESAIKGMLKQSLFFSLNIDYNLMHYTTNTHLVEGDQLIGLAGRVCR